MFLVLLILLLFASADGVPDLGFGGSGKVVTPFVTTAGTPTGAAFRRVVIQPDGKLVAAGDIVVAGVRRIVVVRRWLARVAGGSGVVAHAVAADPNGDRWAVAGSAVIGGVRQLVVARFTAAGVDRGFSGDGVATFSLPGSAEGVYVLPDRRILVASVSGASLVLLRLLPSGELDRTFGGDGLVIGDADAAYAVAADASGKVVAVGREDQQLLVVRYGPSLLPCTRALGCVVVTPRFMTVEVPRALTMSVAVTRADGKQMLRERVVLRRAGPHRVAWRLPPGRYRVRMRAGGRVTTFTMRVGRPSTRR